MPADPIQYLLAARHRLATAQLHLRIARVRGCSGDYRVIGAEDEVKRRLDEVWEAQLAAVADLIVLIGLERAVVLSLGWEPWNGKDPG